ncbi:MAG: hypothetical protein ABW110_25285 [Steroidobacteraceae bacterium]
MSAGSLIILLAFLGGASIGYWVGLADARWWRAQDRHRKQPLVACSRKTTALPARLLRR